MPQTNFMKEAKNTATLTALRKQYLSDLYLNKKEDINAQDELGQTALMTAIINKNFAVAHYFIVLLSANTEMTDHSGQNAADYFNLILDENRILTSKTAEIRGNGSNEDPAFEYLIKFFSSANKKQDNQGISINSLQKIISYAKSGNIEKASKMRDLSTYINAKDIQGKTILMYALENDQYAFATWLLEHEKMTSQAEIDHSGKDAYDYFEEAAKKFYKGPFTSAENIIAFKNLEMKFNLTQNSSVKKTLLRRAEITRDSRMVNHDLLPELRKK